MLKRNKLVILVAMFTLLVPGVIAISITPAVIEVYYNPGSVISQNFYIGNTGGDVNITLEGDLADYAEVSESYLNMESGSGLITVTMIMPVLDTPGEHILYVCAEEIPEELPYGQKPMLGATAKIRGFIETFIPYPGKYVDLSFDYDHSVQVGEKMYFTTTLISRGDEVINKATGNIIITDVDGNDVTSVSLTEVNNLNPSTQQDMQAEWDTTGINPGSYNVKAVVDYDGNSAGTSVYYAKIGDINLNIISLTPIELPEDSIAEITIMSESIWNEIIEYYAVLSINDSSGNVLEEVTSPTAEIDPWKTGSLSVFLNTESLEVGSPYEAEVTLFYDSKETTESFDITIVQSKVQGTSDYLPAVEQSSFNISTTTMLLILALIIIIILVTALVLHKGRKRGGKFDVEEF
ncbi:MAG: hypothetical protein KJ896_00535 [Nanoarchaeota archaeon]|nr:hypothetical protein [Nanoarchaeota archaeon]